MTSDREFRLTRTTSTDPLLPGTFTSIHTSQLPKNWPRAIMCELRELKQEIVDLKDSFMFGHKRWEPKTACAGNTWFSNIL